MDCEASSEIPMGVETIEAATPETNPYSSRTKTLPRYLRASTGSCHDYCKFGHRHGSAETKERVPLRTLIKARTAEQRALGANEDSKPRQSKPKGSVSVLQWRKIGKLSESKSGGEKAENVDSEEDPFGVVDGETPSLKPKQSKPRKRVSVPLRSPIGKVSELKSSGDKTENVDSGDVPEKTPSLKRKQSKPRKHVSVPSRHPIGKASEPKSRRDKAGNEEDVPEKSLYVIESTLESVASGEQSPGVAADLSLPLPRPAKASHSKEKANPTKPSVDSKAAERRKIKKPANPSKPDIGKTSFGRRSARVVASDNNIKAGQKLSFRRGTVLEPKESDKNTAPRRLKFRRVQHIGDGKSGTDSPNSEAKPRRRIASRNKAAGAGLQKRNEANVSINEKVIASEIGGVVAGPGKRREIVSVDMGPARVVLRHHEGELGKREVQSLFNNVIEETASKLVEARKSKVKALVGAFETVITSLQDTKPGLA